MNSFFSRLRSLLIPIAGWRMAAVGFAIAGTIMALLWPLLDRPVSYPEFVTGPHSWAGIPKDRDMLLFWGLAAGALAFYLLLNATARSMITRRVINEGACREGLNLLGLALLPHVAVLALAPDALQPPYAWYFALAGFGVVWSALFLRRKEPMPSPEVYPWPWVIAGILFLALFAGLALAQTASFLMPEKIVQVKGAMQLLAVGPFAGVVTAIAYQILFESGERVSIHLNRLMYLIQWPLPLLAIALLPPYIRYQGEVEVYTTPWLLAGCAVLFVLAAWGGLYRGRPEAVDKSVAGERLGVSIPSLMAIALFVVADARRYPRLWTDDFHLGEIILPWIQWMDFGMTPFVHFFPFHGFMHVISGAVNALFLDGTVARYLDTMTILFGLSAGLTVWAAHRLTGIRVAALCAVMALPQGFYMGRLLFVIPAFLWLADGRLIHRPVRWLLSWLAWTSWLILYNTVSGASFALATLPFALWQTWRAWREESKAFYRLTAGGLLFALIVVAIPYTRSILLGFLQFIQENKFAYAATRGRPWEFSFDQTPFESGWLAHYPIYEIVRFSWLPVLLLAVLWPLSRWAKGQKRCRPSFVFLTMSLVFFGVMMRTYALQRIDAGSASRTGSLSFLVLALYLPVLWGHERPGFRAPVLYGMAVIALIMGCFIGVAERFSWQHMFWKTFRVIDVPSVLERIDGREEGFPRMGTIYVSPDRVAQLRNFRSALEAVAGPDATYWDLTNHQSYYGLLHRPVPVRYAAHASAVNSFQQRIMLEQLKGSPPACIWVDPVIVVDNKANFRSYYLYRYALLNYRVVRRDGFTFMVNEQARGFRDALEPAASVAWLSELFDVPDLGALPAGWGASWGKLSQKARELMALDPVRVKDEGRSDQVWHLDTPIKSVRGTDADLLVVQLEGDNSVSAHAQLTWEYTGGTQPPLTFNARAGLLVIPLGAYPRWLLGDPVTDLSLVVPAGLELVSASLWQREEFPPD